MAGALTMLLLAPIHWTGVATTLPDQNSIKIFRQGSHFSPQEHCDKFNIGAIEVLSLFRAFRTQGPWCSRLRTQVCALHTPGHTRGSICYHCSEATDPQAGVRKNNEDTSNKVLKLPATCCKPSFDTGVSITDKFRSILVIPDVGNADTVLLA